MEYVNAIRDMVADTFLTLPLLIIGFIFFIGSLTSNTGLLYLFIGHLLIVPALGFMSNQPGPAWYNETTFSMTKLIKWVFSCVLVAFVNCGGIGGGGVNYSYMSLLFIPFFAQFIARKLNNDKTVFFFANPVAWFVSSNFNTDERAAATCSMVPNVSDSDIRYGNPSSWMAHLMFLFGFFYANAIAILNLPVPTLGPDATDEQQQKLNARVSNRKWLSSGAMAVGSIILLVLIIFRYLKTPCEGGFLYNFFPLIFITITGYSWFQIVFRVCGIRPPEILGIVQGMLQPSSVDRPIVCVGSPSSNTVAPPTKPLNSYA
jgi:hypothetical protein